MVYKPYSFGNPNPDDYVNGKAKSTFDKYFGLDVLDQLGTDLYIQFNQYLCTHFKIQGQFAFYYDPIKKLSHFSVEEIRALK